MAENKVLLDNCILILVNISQHFNDDNSHDILYLKNNFCGRVVVADEEALPTLDLAPWERQGVVYVGGDIQMLFAKAKKSKRSIKVIRELAFNTEGRDGLTYVELGEVPICLHGIAVYYRQFLSSESYDKNYFDTLQTKHKFQALTESNKSGTSFRKGAYLSEVETNSDNVSKFHLLRCSTNLEGPTLAFVDEDREILSQVNKLAERHFDQKPDLNHVLAQVYENTVTVKDVDRVKERKAKIKSHSDKTKDMPANALIAFCTFYSSDIETYKAPSNDRFGRYFKGGSVLTKLRFKLKADVANLPSAEIEHLPLTKEFSVTLYPNSVLLIPLSTNRLYTHEIVPPTLPVDRFPTRLGYVVRCSKTKAVFKDGETFVLKESKNGSDGDEREAKLEKPTKKGVEELKRLYWEENVRAKKVEYGDVVFSLNEGDYLRPLVEQRSHEKGTDTGKRPLYK